MVFIMNREGTIVETVTSPVHQGSNANEILLLAPFAPTNTVTVGFKLPNGILIQPRLSESGTGETMTALEVNNLFLKIGADEESMSAWYIKINRDLTRYSGELGIQFFIYDGAGDILASSYATVTVQKGVAILDGTTFDTSTATQLQAELNKVYAALTALQSNKVDKINTPHALYATDENGEDTFIGFSYDGKPSAGEIPMYMRNGTLPVGMPEADGDAATKSYVDDAKDEAFSFAFEMASQIDLSYNEEKEELTMTRTVENKVIPLTGVIALKDRVDFLSTLLFNTIITMTEVEDTYTSRVTADGLPVVSNTPTTVHKIAGDTKATDNLFDLAIESGKYAEITISSNNNTWTLSGTPKSPFATLKSVTLPSWIGGKTITISQSKYFAGYTEAGAVYISIVKASSWTTVATSITGSKTVTLEEGVTYNLVILNGNTSSFEKETISFMVNLGETALPYSDYYAGLKNAAFKGITSTGADGETDTSFQLSAARQLRKWDYIDIDNQRVVIGSDEMKQDTEFTDEELATYPAGYILSADRKTIAYPLETPTTAALTVPKSYTAWRNGSETVDTGEADALPPTITQTYYEEVTA